MRLLSISMSLVAALLGGVSHAHGQKATEQYIPLGQSPGVSHRLTSIGTIAAVDPQARTITVAAAAGGHTVRITDKTFIWLDRSKLELTNVRGTFDDLKPGRTVEVKYDDVERKRSADWVKVEITQR